MCAARNMRRRAGDECTVNIRGTLCGRQPHLRVGFARPHDCVLHDGNVPPARKSPSDHRRLVEPAFAPAGGAQGNGHEHRLLALVPRPAQARDARGQLLAKAVPSAVFQLVDQFATKPVRDPAHRARAYDAVRQHHTPATGTALRGMTAPVARGCRQDGERAPAVETHQAGTLAEQAFA